MTQANEPVAVNEKQDKSMERLAEILRENGIACPHYHRPDDDVSKHPVITFLASEEDALRVSEVTLQLNYPLRYVSRRWDCSGNKVLIKQAVWELHFIPKYQSRWSCTFPQ